MCQRLVQKNHKYVFVIHEEILGVIGDALKSLESLLFYIGSYIITYKLFFLLILDNAIPIKSWFSDPADTALLNLLPFLDSLRFCSDVRSVLGRNLHTYRTYQ